MSRIGHSPRPEQVELLTQGVPLPLHALADVHLLVIIQALATAWDELVRSRRVLDSHDEPAITAMMVSVLNKLRDVDRRWEMLVTSVGRGQEMINFDGSRLEVRPDLSIQLTDRRASFPLIVECKLIDRTSKKTVRLYGNQGLVRFVQGDYAWYAREAIMVAYVRDDSTIISCLTPHLKKHLGKDPYGYGTEHLPELDIRVPHDLARSRHRRSYRYLEPNGEPGPITVWHLWLPPG